VGLESGDLQILRDGQVTVFEGAYDGFWLPGGSAPPVLSSDGSCAVLQSAFYDIEADQVVDLPSEGWFWLPVSPS
jgi:hypothetical protein